MAGHVQTGLHCKECELNLEPNCLLEEHQRSRQHLNRLLQLGMELPLNSISQTQDDPVHEGNSKIAYCITCELSIGNALQAATHYRSREHFNRRLQRGLPVPHEPERSPASRSYFNECLRHGVGLPQPSVAQPIRPSTNHMPPTRGVNGKRKFPASFNSPAYNPTQMNSASHFTNFAAVKRPCRPLMSLHKPEVNFTARSFVGQAMSYNKQVQPGSSLYSTASVRSNAYHMQPVRMPATSLPYGVQFHNSQAAASWNSTLNGDYSKDTTMNARWCCEICHIDFSNEAAWQSHLSGVHSNYKQLNLGAFA